LIQIEGMVDENLNYEENQIKKYEQKIIFELLGLIVKVIDELTIYALCHLIVVTPNKDNLELLLQIVYQNDE